MLVLDLGVSCKAHVIRSKKRRVSAVIALAFFNLGVYFAGETAVEFDRLSHQSLTTRVCLSPLFSYWCAPFTSIRSFSGDLGAWSSDDFHCCRRAMIQRFHWILYFDIPDSDRHQNGLGKDKNPSRKDLAFASSAALSVTDHYERAIFRQERWALRATPYSSCYWWWKRLISFCQDSIPAIFAITLDPIVYTQMCSRDVGITGTLLCAGWDRPVCLLHFGFSAILVFLKKMLLADFTRFQ
jgi:hypothetical protein